MVKGEKRRQSATRKPIKIMESEKLLERKLRIGVEKRGGECWKLAGGFVTGLPDRLILLPGGRAAFAEVKTTGEKPKPRQVYIIKLLLKLGFPVFVIDSEETLQKCLNDISEL